MDHKKAVDALYKLNRQDYQRNRKLCEIGIKLKLIMPALTSEEELEAVASAYRTESIEFLRDWIRVYEETRA